LQERIEVEVFKQVDLNQRENDLQVTEVAKLLKKMLLLSKIKQLEQITINADFVIELTNKFLNLQIIQS